MDRILSKESERRYKLETVEVRERLALSNSFACRVEVALSRVAKIERQARIQEKRSASRKNNQSAASSSHLNGTFGFGGAASLNRTGLSCSIMTEDLRHHHGMAHSPPPLIGLTTTGDSPDDGNREHLRNNNNNGNNRSNLRSGAHDAFYSFVDADEQVRHRSLVDESRTLRQARLKNLQSTWDQSKLSLQAACDSAMDYSMSKGASRHASVVAFTKKLQHELVNRLDCLSKASNDKAAGFLSPPSKRLTLAPIHHAAAPAARTPSPKRSARLHSPHTTSTTAATPPPTIVTVDSKAIAEATCTWISQVAADEAEAKRMADRALTEIQREVNIEARRQREQQLASRKLADDESVARTAMKKAVEVAQARATQSVRSLAAQSRTISRISEAQLRLAKLPACMRHAASVFSVQELDAVMAKRLDANMRETHARRRVDMIATIAGLEEKLSLAQAAMTAERSACEQVLASSQGSAEEPPLASHVSVLDVRFDSKVLSKTSVTSTAAAHRQLLHSTLKQLHSRILSPPMPSPKKFMLGKEIEPAVLLHPTLAVVEALLMVSRPPRSMSVPPSLVAPAVGGGAASATNNKRSQSNPRSSTGRSLNETTAAATATTPAATAQGVDTTAQHTILPHRGDKSTATSSSAAAGVLDLSACHTTLTRIDFTLIQEVMSVLQPRLSGLVLSREHSRDERMAEGVLRLCLEFDAITSVQVAEVGADDGVQYNATDDATTPAADTAVRVMNRVHALIRRNREISLLQRALRIAKQKAEGADAQESTELMTLPLLRKRLVETVRLLVQYFEEGVRWGRSVVKLAQQRSWERILIAETRERAERLIILQRRALHTEAQREVFADETAQRAALENLCERDVHLMTKEHVTLKKSFRRLSRRFTKGVLSMRRSISNPFGPTMSLVMSPTTTAAAADATSSKHDDNLATVDSAVVVDVTTTSRPGTAENDDDEGMILSASPTAADTHPLNLFTHQTAGSSSDAAAPFASNGSDTGSSATTGDAGSALRIAEAPPPPTPSATATRMSVDEVVPRYIHSSNATSRPKPVVFHQSPPPSRQKLD